MANPFHHAQSSAKRFGGTWQDYHAIHSWFDQTKAALANPRHRAVLHSAVGIYIAEQVFGPVVVRASDRTAALVAERTRLQAELAGVEAELVEAGRAVPVRYVGEQHVREDCGFVPTLSDWLANLPLEEWMQKGPRQFSETIKL